MMRGNLENIVGVILAGGKSSRMGKSKALLEFGGQPLVDHMRCILQQTGLGKVYISGTLPGYACIPDEISHRGPANAIRTVSGWLRNGVCRGALFVPVDMPFLTPALLRPLMQSVELPAYYEQWPLPLYMPLTQKLAGGRAVKEMLEELQVKPLPFPVGHEDRFANLNTPEEWQEAIER